jgi:hypothetical protein
LFHFNGFSIFQQLTHCWFLTEQMRTTDPAFAVLLQGMRDNNADVVDANFQLLQSRLPDHTSAPPGLHLGDYFDDVLLTTRNSVRVAVNFAKSKALATHQLIEQLVVLAVDTPGKKASPGPLS